MIYIYRGRVDLIGGWGGGGGIVVVGGWGVVLSILMYILF